ncbi:cyanophycin synthetase [Pseudoduganella chitinolytica]|uniref:Cyanophycin synthetase n=1 Tax=Pseudoduganella chitinolytica TaxID=34070 RepID=A0ABY8BJ18_9BURK|nr:cyanophycin synthetase [Pseudoduganella chitinolytica]WEF34948.1 cyanophycin synthetase [Pseudoduganella chitinolytica]
MNIIEQRILRGRNYYSDKPCVMTLLELDERRPTDELPGFNDAVLAVLPQLVEHRCSIGKYAGFVQALRAGTSLAHVVEHVALALQCEAGTTVSFGRTRPGGAPDRYRVVVAYATEQVALEAVDAAIALVTALAQGAAVDLETWLPALRDTAERHAIGTSTGAILRAAERRGIPYVRLTEQANMFLLGWGSQQKRLQATITGDTGHIAVEIASDKGLTKALLQQAGVPVPEGTAVRTLEQAQRAAARLGGLVTVKPLDGNHGRGVTTRCGTPEEVQIAFERAREHGRTIIVERFIDGDDYRILVAGGRVVAAARRRPPQVTGDGASTIRELVELENRNPARGDGHTNILTKIPLDGLTETALAEQGHSFDTVLPAGVTARLRGNANLSSGGTAEDVTDLLPALTRTLCVRAVQKVGLDVAGIDLVCRDIAAPLAGGNGAFIEINAAPGIRMHEYPSAGTPRDAGAAIVDSMFGDGDGRIPVIAVTGTNGKTTTTLMLEHAVRAAGLHTGCATTEGVYLDGACIQQGDCSGYWSARAVLSAPEVEFAVLETARGGIMKRGLGYDRCDVSVVLNVTADHLGQDGIDSVEQLAEVKGVVARSARKACVLNAEDPLCVQIAGTLPEGVETIYFAVDAEAPVLLRHLERGGRAAYLQDGALILADGQARHRLLWAEEMPAAVEGCARHNIANALAAAAALMATDFGVASIADGLASFVCDGRSNPLRTNIYDVRGIKVIVDYAHNPAAYQALGQMARTLTRGRACAIVTAPGDRRDDTLAAIGAACGAAFDEVVAYEWNAEDRGRARGERAAVIAAGAGPVGKVKLDCGEALRTALARCQPGDVLLFACGSSTDELVDALRVSDPESAERIAQALVA